MAPPVVKATNKDTPIGKRTRNQFTAVPLLAAPKPADDKDETEDPHHDSQPMDDGNASEASLDAEEEDLVAAFNDQVNENIRRESLMPRASPRRSPRNSPAVSARSMTSSSSCERDDERHPRRRTTHACTKRDQAKLSRNGWLSWIGTLAREAVFDCYPPTPGTMPKHLHLYWARLPPSACAQSLIKRSTALQKEAVERGGIAIMAKEIATTVTLHSRKARNKHVNQIRDLFFSPSSKSELVRHVLTDTAYDINGISLPMTVVPSLRHLTVSSLASLLKSSDLHADRILYPMFVQGMAAGKLSKVRKQQDGVPLNQFISVNYEAHYRIEMWFCLQKQGQSPVIKGDLASS